MKKKCKIKGCDNPSICKNMCIKHYNRVLKHGDPFYTSRAPNGSGSTSNGYRNVSVNGRAVFEHVLIAERILGRRLKYPEQVHHFDENRMNNKNSNLIICPNGSYHKLLHRRQAALNACGNPDFLKCRYCKNFDDPKNMYVRASVATHRECANKYLRKWKKHAKSRDRQAAR